MRKAAHLPISDELLKEIRVNVRRRQLQALDTVVPWNEKDHPELKDGAAKHIRRLRREFFRQRS
jgi:hypothetical protein